MESRDQHLYRLGRRHGIFARIEDMQNPLKMAEVEEVHSVLGVTLQNMDEITDKMMIGFV